MSSDQDNAYAFRDSNAEIYNLVKFGAFKQDPSEIKDILNDRQVKSKLSKVLNFYQKPNPQSKSRLDSFKWGGTQPLTTMIKTFLVHLSLKLDLDEELTFRLVELFFITHPGLFEKVKSSENEEVKKELSSSMRPITILYYKERINLIRTVVALILNSNYEENPAQEVFLEFFEDCFSTQKLDQIVWQQYSEACKRELPSQVFVPHEREEWFIQVLEEQKILLELLILCNYTYAHVSPESYYDYLNLYVRQNFQGSFSSMENDMHLPEYRAQQRKLTQVIGDLCVFHLLSCIRLDVFAEKGAIPEFNPNRNPYNLISSKDLTPKICNFFVTLEQNSEFVSEFASEHIGPVLVSWIALLTWGHGLPEDCTVIPDLTQLETIAPNYDIFGFMHQLTRREPFLGPSSELSCALKYILMSLISRLHTALEVEGAKNYSMLVKTTCACLETSGSSDTLRHFWNQDYSNRSGLYLMLEILSKKYPHSAEEFLQFVSVLIGDSSCCFASEIEEYLDKLQYFSINVPVDAIAQLADGVLVCKYEMSSSRIVIPKDTQVVRCEPTARDQYLVTWKVRFSLWPVLFNHWETILDSMKLGHQISEVDLRNLCQYLEILCKVIILEPRLGDRLEVSGLRQPANHALEIQVVFKQRDIPNQVISEYLLDTFVELSKIYSPPLSTLSSIIAALKSLYVIESENIERNPLAEAFRKVVLEHHGYGGINSPHPMFLSLSKLRVFEKSTEDYSVTYSMLEFCVTVFSDESCMRIFPMSTSGFLGELLKYSLGEALPEVLTMSGLYRWRNSQLVLGLLKVLIEKYSHFIDNTHQPCPFIDMISSQLNKANVSGFIETIIQVIAQQDEFNEINFYNIHYSQTDDVEELGIIKSMIASALLVLEKILDIVLYIHENGNNTTFIIQAAADIYRMIYQNTSNDELPIVSALLSYVPFYLSNAMPEDSEKENIAVISLNCLTKIVLIWEKSNQKALLDYFIAGPLQDIRKGFVECFEECFCSKSASLSEGLKLSVTLAYLEFLIVSVGSQKNFVSVLLTSFDFCNEMKRNFQSFRDLNRDTISLTPLSLLFHLISLYEKLVSEPKKYPGLCNKLIQDTSLFNSAVDTLQTLVCLKRDPKGFDLCLLLQTYASVFRILVQYMQQKSYADTVHLVFHPEVLSNFLQLSFRTQSSESTLLRLQDMDSQLVKQGCPAGIAEFLQLQAHKDWTWRMFECNSAQYGLKFKYNIPKMLILLSSLDSPIDLIRTGFSNFNAASAETSLLDSQNTALASFKTLLAYTTSFGYSGKVNSALHTDIPSSELKPLLISAKNILHDNIKEALELISIIVEHTWNGIKNENNFKNQEVITGINHRFEILMYSFSYIIHVTSSKVQQRSDDNEKTKVEFRRLSGKILAELVDFFNALRYPSHEMLAFTLMLLSYFAKTNGFESKPEDYLYGLVQHLSKFLYVESPNFALTMSCLEYTLQLSDRRDYVNVFKSLPGNRVVIEKLVDEKCTDLECLSILKYLVSMCKTAAGAKFLIGLRVFQHLAGAPVMKNLEAQKEYEGRQRSPSHVLWCWALLLLNQIAEVMGSDQIALSQMLAFAGEFNWRISRVLEFNFTSTGKGGEIMNQKQFSMAYLEEVEITLSFLHRLLDGYNLLKKTDKEKVDYWMGIVAMHTMRIFGTSTDHGYVFPPITEHDQRISQRTMQDTLTESKAESSKQKRSIFDPIPRISAEPKQKRNSTQVSVFSYWVQMLEMNILENMLSAFIGYYQITRALPPVDMQSLVGASKYLLSCYTLVANNTNFFANLDRITVEEFRDPEVTSVNGGISHRYEAGVANFMKTTKRNFEMVGYLLMKYEFSKNTELKQICLSVIGEWIKVTDTDIGKSEHQENFLEYVLDQIST